MRFVGREAELKALGDLYRKKTASLVVIRGRRRIGKSRLAQEYAKRFENVLEFIGLPPSEAVSAQAQRDEFGRQLRRRLEIGGIQTDDWGDLFDTLGDHLPEGRTLVVFDEITWMGNEDPTFLGKLKTAWDQRLSRHPQAVVVLSGSVSTWIGKNILNSTGFFGRVSLEIDLDELPLDACAAFWPPAEDHVSGHEVFRVLGVTGGVPRYLEEIIPLQSAEQNIARLCFSPGGLLVREFDRIFSDLFDARAGIYRQLVERISEGPMAPEEAYRVLNSEKSGTVLGYLDDLVTSGFVRRDYTWKLGALQPSKLSRYRLSDNYLRFYLKNIAPQRNAIEAGRGRMPTNWAAVMGLQFENLILNNRKMLWSAIGVEPSTIAFDNPYFQTQTKRRRGCQIDYLIHDRFGTLYVCEIKFSRQPLGVAVVSEARNRIKRLSRPRGTSVRPVLVHASSVTDELIDSGFFAEVVDATRWLGTG